MSRLGVATENYLGMEVAHAVASINGAGDSDVTALCGVGPAGLSAVAGMTWPAVEPFRRCPHCYSAGAGTAPG